MERVAVVGAGTSGICAARYLTSHGFDVTVLEAYADIGGQWNRSNPRSGVWPGMRTNTLRAVTKLSDVQYPDEVALFPRNEEVLAMLREVVRVARIERCFRFGAQVTAVALHPGGGYDVTVDGVTETYDRVVVASGRFNAPSSTAVPGLDGFSGVGGVRHSFNFPGTSVLRDLRVLVLGGGISSLEIAGDLAMGGASAVHLAQRRQRFVVPKLHGGTPVEYLMLTRGQALADETAGPTEALKRTRALLLDLFGSPADYGAPAPHRDMARAGISGSQHYPALVAEDRIKVHPWVSHVEGTTVTFTDGNSVNVDAVLVGTGFDLSLPFLDDEIARTVEVGPDGLSLADFTFHPDLPGLAFLGMWPQLGAYPVVLEQQARWLAYAWAGLVQSGSLRNLQNGLLRSKTEGHRAGYRFQNEMAMRFARLADTDPCSVQEPELRLMLDAAAATGESFRLVGPDAVPEAADHVARDFDQHASPAAKAALRRLYEQLSDVPESSSETPVRQPLPIRS